MSSGLSRTRSSPRSSRGEGRGEGLVHELSSRRSPSPEMRIANFDLSPQAGRGVPRSRSHGRHLRPRVTHMAITISASDHAVPGAPLSARLSTPQVWGIVLLAPYLLVFLAFVVYPVGYGFWLARHPASYVALVSRSDLRARRRQHADLPAHRHQSQNAGGAVPVRLLRADARPGSNGCRCCSSCPGRCRRSRPSCRCASCSIPNGAWSTS